MKKLLSLLCVILLILLTGCAGSKDTPTTTAQKAEETSPFPEFSTVDSTSDVVSRVREMCNTLYYKGSEKAGEFNNSLNIPALNFSAKGASELNQKMMMDSADDIEFFDEIKENNYLLRIEDVSQAKTAVISHKWRSFNKLTVIEVDREYGTLDSSDARKTSNIYYYDRGNDKELSFDEMLVKLGATKEALFAAFSENEKNGSDYTVDSIKGIFPDTDTKWHILLDNGNSFTAVEIKAPV